MVTIDADPHTAWGLEPVDQMLLALDICIQHKARIRF